MAAPGPRPAARQARPDDRDRAAFRTARACAQDPPAARSAGGSSSTLLVDFPGILGPVRAFAGHEEHSRYARRTISVAQRGQIVQRVIVDGWTSIEVAAAFGVPRRTWSSVWVTDFRRHGMASLRQDPGRTIAVGDHPLYGMASGAGDVAQTLDRPSRVFGARAARPALAAAPFEQGRPAVAQLTGCGRPACAYR